MADDILNINGKLIRLRDNGDGTWSWATALTGSLAQTTVLTQTPLSAGASFDTGWQPRAANAELLLIDSDVPLKVQVLEAASTNPASYETTYQSITPPSWLGGSYASMPIVLSQPYRQIRITNYGTANQTRFVALVRPLADGFLPFHTWFALAYDVAVRDALYHSMWTNTLTGMEFLISRFLCPTLFYIKNSTDQSISVNLITADPTSYNFKSGLSVAAGATVLVSTTDVPMLGRPFGRRYEISFTASEAPTTGGLYVYGVAVPKLGV